MSINDTDSDIKAALDYATEKTQALAIGTVRSFEDPETGDTILFTLDPELNPVSLHSLADERRLYPRQRRGVARFTDLASFVEHANMFKKQCSALFGDGNIDAPKLVSVLDYHEHGPGGTASNMGHRGEYLFPLSDELTTWNRMNSKPMTVAVFSEFLEENSWALLSEERLGDVLDTTEAGMLRDKIGQCELVVATPSGLIKLSRGISVYSKSETVNSVKLSSGEGELSFKTEHQDKYGAPLKIPTAFLLRLPIFLGGRETVLLVRLRYTATDGKVLFTYNITELRATFKREFEHSCLTAKEGTSLPLLYGKPEA